MPELSLTPINRQSFNESFSFSKFYYIFETLLLNKVGLGELKKIVSDSQIISRYHHDTVKVSPVERKMEN